MKILVCNCGSVSFKSQLIDTDSERRLFRFTVDRIGTPSSSVSWQLENGKENEIAEPVGEHREAVRLAVETMLGPAIQSIEEIAGVGHRVVHGGEEFTASVVVDQAVERKIEAVAKLAPLHNPGNLSGIRAARAILPHAPQVAVFDTAFHQTLPARAARYALAQPLYRDLGVRRYGFHGTSYRYVLARYAETAGRRIEELKVIACHLGGGCSVCAVDRGRSVDTSMGMTPLEGLVMGTRGGDVDAGILLYLMRDLGWSVARVDDLLNRQSGLLGLSGVSGDVRPVLEAEAAGNDDARLALDVFCYRVRKYIGAYFAALDGCDALLFTAGVGEHSAVLRQRICEGTRAMGIVLDQSANDDAIGREARISAPQSSIDVWVIPTNEELMIARDTARCILNARAATSPVP